jgi:competence protein ComEA
MWKRFVSPYFSFTKKERTGIVALMILILVILVLPFFFSFFISQKKYDHTQFEKEIDVLQIISADSGDTKNYYSKKDDEDNYQDYNEPSYKKYDKPAEGELFYFDPNTLDEAGWKKLGVRDKPIQTIQKYLSKGGKFKTPEDISKIWGLSPELIERITPYVKIAQASEPANKQYTPSTYEKKEYKKDIGLIDVNLADTTAFIGLPGIGNKLANRIIAFRNKLGGFYKTDQVGETFLLPDSTFQKIRSRLVLSNSTVKQININTATIDELKAHPYIRYYIGNAIIQYRTQHGKFSSIEDIKKIALVTDDIFNKVSPYLKVSD